MRPGTWFRIAFWVMLLFAAGHTYGFLSFRPATAEGQAVWTAMNGVHFSADGQTFSYGGFYVGLGLSCTAAMLFQAWLTWRLARMADRGMEEARAIGWAMCALQVVSIALSLRYFAAPPAVLSVLAAGCYAMGAIRMKPSTQVQAE
ncbi:MAG TPA: hypothetical protein VGN01_11760 [Acidobacteriaceae bacterium]|jgi:hypothetical protein